MHNVSIEGWWSHDHPQKKEEMFVATSTCFPFSTVTTGNQVLRPWCCVYHPACWQKLYMTNTLQQTPEDIGKLQRSNVLLGDQHYHKLDVKLTRKGFCGQNWHLINSTDGAFTPEYFEITWFFKSFAEKATWETSPWRQLSTAFNANSLIKHFTPRQKSP